MEALTADEKYEWSIFLQTFSIRNKNKAIMKNKVFGISTERRQKRKSKLRKTGIYKLSYIDFLEFQGIN